MRHPRLKHPVLDTTAWMPETRPRVRQQRLSTVNSVVRQTDICIWFTLRVSVGEQGVSMRTTAQPHTRPSALRTHISRRLHSHRNEPPHTDAHRPAAVAGHHCRTTAHATAHPRTALTQRRQR